jgi:hypothetical protein
LKDVLDDDLIHTIVHGPYARTGSDIKDTEDFLGINIGSIQLAIDCHSEQVMLEI